MTDLERQFTKDMINIYTTTKRECGYQANRFLQLVGRKRWGECCKAANS